MNQTKGTPGKRKNKVPERQCCVCRAKGDKRSLLRIVRDPEGNAVYDPTGKRNGRGAYICRDEACLLLAKKSGRIAKALKGTAEEGLYDTLLAAIRSEDE